MLNWESHGGLIKTSKIAIKVVHMVRVARVALNVVLKLQHVTHIICQPWNVMLMKLPELHCTRSFKNIKCTSATGVNVNLTESGFQHFCLASKLAFISQTVVACIGSHALGLNSSFQDLSHFICPWPHMLWTPGIMHESHKADHTKHLSSPDNSLGTSCPFKPNFIIPGLHLEFTVSTCWPCPWISS